jgi:hypothetical protein
MRVLIGCEMSGIVRDAFAANGHDAWSNDLVDSIAGGKHLKMCVIEAITEHGPWDFIGLHPPCTALAVSGNRWYGKGMPHNNKRLQAVQWTVDLWKLACNSARHAYLENPVGVIPVPFDQYFQPWEHGHGETKKTGLILHNLPKLRPSKLVEGREQRVWKMGPSEDRAMLRSLTYKGVAEAMATQWSSLHSESPDQPVSQHQA